MDPVVSRAPRYTHVVPRKPRHQTPSFWPSLQILELLLELLRQRRVARRLGIEQVEDGLDVSERSTVARTFATCSMSEAGRTGNDMVVSGALRCCAWSAMVCAVGWEEMFELTTTTKPVRPGDGVKGARFNMTSTTWEGVPGRRASGTWDSGALLLLSQIRCSLHLLPCLMYGFWDAYAL